MSWEESGIPFPWNNPITTGGNLSKELDVKMNKNEDDDLCMGTLFNKPQLVEPPQEPKSQGPHVPYLSKRSKEGTVKGEERPNDHTHGPFNESHTLYDDSGQNNDISSEQHVKLRTGSVPQLEKIGIALKAKKLPKLLFGCKTGPKTSSKS